MAKLIIHTHKKWRALFQVPSTVCTLYLELNSGAVFITAKNLSSVRLVL
jgi:hypothetical protein